MSVGGFGPMAVDISTSFQVADTLETGVEGDRANDNRLTRTEVAKAREHFANDQFASQEIKEFWVQMDEHFSGVADGWQPEPGITNRWDTDDVLTESDIMASFGDKLFLFCP